MGKLKWILIGAVGLVVLAVGGALIYSAINDAPAKPTLTADEGDGSAVDDNVAGTWSATEQSLVAYRVQETLAGIANEAYGSTSDVSGTLTIDGTDITATEITVQMASVKSTGTGSGLRDNQFNGRIMETSTYPTATFKLTEPIQLGSIPEVGTPVSERATGELTLHGVTKTITFDLTAQRRSNGTIEVNAKDIPIKFADYNINDPSGGRAVVSVDSGSLEFLLVFAKG